MANSIIFRSSPCFFFIIIISTCGPELPRLLKKRKKGINGGQREREEWRRSVLYLKRFAIDVGAELNALATETMAKKSQPVPERSRGRDRRKRGAKLQQPQARNNFPPVL